MEEVTSTLNKVFSINLDVYLNRRTSEVGRSAPLSKRCDNISLSLEDGITAIIM